MIEPQLIKKVRRIYSTNVSQKNKKSQVFTRDFFVVPPDQISLLQKVSIFFLVQTGQTVQ